MSLEDLEFELPKELIAYQPCPKRDHSRLMIAREDATQITQFFNIPHHLRPGDLLVLNNTKVINAKLTLNTAHEKKVTVYLDSKCSKGNWHAFAKPSRLLSVGDELRLAQEPDYKFVVLKKGEGGRIKLAFSSEAGMDIHKMLDLYGQIPLPPYIKKEVTPSDKERYQTVFSKNLGSVAAPTAGLHFTDQLLKNIADKEIEIAFITLHVGSGTFLPIKGSIETHVMHQENGFIEEKDAYLINQARANGRRVVAVGTTVLRTLEYMMHNFGEVKAGSFSTNLFIKPSFEFKIVDLLITNFHLPKSTLLLLVKAFAGENLINNAYQQAITHKMRFFSYGDAMLLYKQKPLT
ncbi:tRNA preQ1(34) S-adenosylmethionine ribosyltransferase-isomerase QueA [Candidatus Sarmatiella mevalonica]|uniref:tRNA preQ1(34) S-adenosylmethionine ribosyltransferase-isomerase QueA n=1 Tax=Candidatus Sarmatiella mevalonica TaxID=2770581 RepID=UPI001922B9D7